MPEQKIRRAYGYIPQPQQYKLVMQPPTLFMLNILINFYRLLYSEVMMCVLQWVTEICVSTVNFELIKQCYTL